MAVFSAMNINAKVLKLLHCSAMFVVLIIFAKQKLRLIFI